MPLGTLEYFAQKTKNGQVGYVTCGKGKPLILIVGYSGTLFHWNAKFIEHLAEYYTLYLIDNRKIGLSESSNSQDIQGFATDVVDFIVAKNLDKPLIFGWSMGGVITQELAKSHADIIAGIVLFATIPQLNYVKFDFISLLTKSTELSEEEFKIRLYGFFFSEKPRLSLKDYVTNHVLNFANYNYRFSDEARDLQHLAIASWGGMDEQMLQSINLPVLILKARDDMVVKDESGEFLLNNLPNSKLIIYPRGGHFLVHSAPQEISNDIHNFFNSLEG